MCSGCVSAMDSFDWQAAYAMTRIALSANQRFKPGALLIVEQSVPSQGVFRVPVRGVYATPEKEGRWVIDCVFVVPDSKEDLRTSQA